jgi:U4/U6.U5 tri-snRNP-associated protein 2
VFLSWLLNVLNTFFNSKKPKQRFALLDDDNDDTNATYQNIIEKYFTGTLQVETFTLIKDDNDKATNKHLTIAHIDGIEYFYTKHTTSFFYLSLDLPNTPLFKDSQEKINIPQISILELLTKFSGNKFIEDPVKDQRRKYKILSYPKYLILVFKRFENNMFFIEKNPTIVNFATERLVFGDMRGDHAYDLIANVIHDGKPNSGSFRVQVLNKASGEWYEIQDLSVDKIMPQSVTVSESYIHFYERKKI